MLVRDFLQRLVQVDLYNLHLTEDGTNTIRQDRQEWLLHNVNAGLADLSLRLNLKEQTSQEYELTQGNHKITFDDVGLMQILSVYLTKIGLGNLDNVVLPYKLSHQIEPQSAKSINECVQPTYYQSAINELYINNPYPQASYQINLRKSLGQRLLGLNDELPVPVVYHNALGLFVASRMLKSMDNQLDGDLNESMRYFNRYMAEIQTLEQQGMELDNQPQQHLFFERGFV